MQSKKNFIRWLLIFLLLVLLFSYRQLSSSDSPNVIQGKVVFITDGDDLTILLDKKQYKIRLAEIYTPEWNQPYGSKAQEVLSDLVFRKEVIAKVQDIDKYERYVARIYVGELDINAELVKRGAAWVYRDYSTDELFYEYENNAKENELGILGLSDSQKIPPWEWRRGVRADPIFASEDLEKLTITDWHVHVAGLGYGNSENFVNETMRNNYRFKYFSKWMNVTGKELETFGDQIVIERLNKRIEQSKYIDKAIILALDGVIDKKTKQLDKVNTQYYVDNDFVSREASKYPKLLFGASINPSRENSIELLENVYGQGAVLIKWIPSIMHFDPADKTFEPFYRKMAELNIPLLTHTGMEKSFPNTNDSLADPRRLELALKSGVTVIAAHIATTGKSEGQDNFERILPMFDEFPNLYADISSLTQINKLGYLAKALKIPKLTEKMIYGTDWPMQYFPVVSPWFHIRHIGFKNALRLSSINNKWDQDIELKQAYGVPYGVFSRTVGRINDL